jgi:hypothetical protein
VVSEAMSTAAAFTTGAGISLVVRGASDSLAGWNSFRRGRQGLCGSVVVLRQTTTTAKEIWLRIEDHIAWQLLQAC